MVKLSNNTFAVNGKIDTAFLFCKQLDKVFVTEVID